MEKSRMSYIAAALCAVFAAFLLAWFMIAHPGNKEIFVYGAGILLCGALVGLLLGLKYRMEERGHEDDNALWTKRNKNNGSL